MNAFRNSEIWVARLAFDLGNDSCLGAGLLMKRVYDYHEAKLFLFLLGVSLERGFSA